MDADELVQARGRASPPSAARRAGQPSCPAVGVAHDLEGAVVELRLHQLWGGGDRAGLSGMPPRPIPLLLRAGPV